MFENCKKVENLRYDVITAEKQGEKLSPQTFIVSPEIAAEFLHQLVKSGWVITSMSINCPMLVSKDVNDTVDQVMERLKKND